MNTTQNNNTNPFFYQSASDLAADQIIQYYAEGGNITHTLASKDNCYLVGERGSGKSMALKYHSFPAQRLLHTSPPPHDIIGIYIPCNTPLMHKNEASLFDEFTRLAIVEHCFNLSIAHHTCHSLRQCCTLPAEQGQKALLEQFSYSLALDCEIPLHEDIFSSILSFISREVTIAQRALNAPTQNRLPLSYTFFSLILPLLEIIRKIEDLQSSHFSFLFDDAHLLSPDRRKVLNSYISYRDHTAFSFKAAIASCEDYVFTTVDGSSLAPGHDFSLINMEEDFQNSRSDYGRFLRNIVTKRLSECKITATPDDFFRISPALQAGIEDGKSAARDEAIKKYGPDETKRIKDYVYKYGRARYFRQRDPKASLPQYSGLDTIAHVSTGVIRNALYPCWKMFELQQTRLNGELPTQIHPSVQAEVLKEESDALWASIRKGFGNKIEGCTKDDSDKIENFFTALAKLFRERLQSECAEPRLLSFIVSEPSSPHYESVKRLLTLCRKAQLLYERYGPGKVDGRRETYYATNRLLWIAYGLDPDGQHGRLSLKATDIATAAVTGVFPSQNDTANPEIQIPLF